ncbi:MAG: nucleoside triphosphate pyrophosphatase [Patescibacteria group bacterium]
MRKIVLASSSPRRKEIFSKTKLPFIVDLGDYEEDMTLKMKPIELAKFLSRGKAESVAKRHKNAIVIGADTFIAHKDIVLGKPHISRKAKEMLKMLSGKTHSVVTGYTIIDTKTGKSISRTNESKIHFRKISDREIDAYVKTGEPLDKAGAYAVQERGAVFIKKIEGDFMNVMGLPLYEIMEELKKFGIKPFM